MKPNDTIDGWTQGELALQHGGQASGTKRGNGAAKANGKNPPARLAPADRGELTNEFNSSFVTGEEFPQSRPSRAVTAAALAPAPSRGSTAGRLVIGGTLAATGIILAGGGMLMTVNYTVATATGLDRALLAGLAAGSDLLALLMPSAGACLWRARRHVPAAVAGVLWIIAASITLQNLSGFVGAYGDSFIAGREAASTQRSLLFDRLTRLRTERKAITESRSTGEITIAIRNATAKKIDDERLALQQARRRDQIDADLATIEQTVGNSPNLSQADPAAATISSIVSLISGGRLVIADDMFRRARLLALITLPLLGGLILATGAALTAKERTP
jgi:hypothetical protein